MREKAWGNEYRTTVVCIDSYERGIPVGRFYNPYLKDGESFQSLMEFLRKLDQTLDNMTFPQSFASKRSFFPSGEQAQDKAPEAELQTGRKATFALKVLFRQNASWQGSLAWLEGKREESFRSVLEMVFLLDSALQDE